MDVNMDMDKVMGVSEEGDSSSGRGSGRRSQGKAPSSCHHLTRIWETIDTVYDPNVTAGDKSSCTSSSSKSSSSSNSYTISTTPHYSKCFQGF